MCFSSFWCLCRSQGILSLFTPSMKETARPKSLIGDAKMERVLFLFLFFLNFFCRSSPSGLWPGTQIQNSLNSPVRTAGAGRWAGGLTSGQNTTGVVGRVQLPSDAVLYVNYTIMAWLRTSTSPLFSGFSLPQWFSCSQDANICSNVTGYSMGRETNGVLYVGGAFASVATPCGSGSSSGTSATAYNTPTWTHMAYVYSTADQGLGTNRLCLYVNGSATNTCFGSTATVTVNLLQARINSGNSTQHCRIGAALLSDLTYHGVIDEFRVFRESLSTAEINAAMQYPYIGLLPSSLTGPAYVGTITANDVVISSLVNSSKSITISGQVTISGASASIFAANSLIVSPSASIVLLNTPSSPLTSVGSLMIGSGASLIIQNASVGNFTIATFGSISSQFSSLTAIQAGRCFVATISSSVSNLLVVSISLCATATTAASLAPALAPVFGLLLVLLALLY